jgi:hypothetical protein
MSLCFHEFAYGTEPARVLNRTLFTIYDAKCMALVSEHPAAALSLAFMTTAGLLGNVVTLTRPF